MMNTRRDFLKASGLVVMAGAAGFLGTEQFVYGDNDSPVKAADGRQKATLVTIFLRGGCDALNALVPVGDRIYYKARKRIALHLDAPTKGKAKGDKGALPFLDSKYWGINHGLAKLIPLIEKGTCAPFINVGNPNPTRSHFSAQDYMERGAGGDGVSTGWLNRYLEATKKPFDAPLRGLSAQTLVPRALRGSYPVLAGNNSTDEMALFQNLYSPKNMVNMTARDGANDQKGSRLDDLNTSAPKRGLSADMTRDIIAQSGANAIERIKALQKAEATENAADYPQGGLGSQLATIARVIKADVGLEVAQADYGGWDHHSGQGGADGRHTQMLRHLAECMTAFHADLGARMDRVMLLVMTEFGRTVDDNGASGTDHGRAGFMLAMGDMLKGPKMYGAYNGLQDLDSGRFLPVRTDFRAVFSESLAKLFRFDPIRARIFPDYTPHGLLDFMKAVPEA
ncbi:MAG TPA: DUF1501 domain-containing protein [Tepidisphaeraceae bacterium]|nr:DUF1501 domain-containing protein [Tepidisphaeraceae bacterium]